MKIQKLLSLVLVLIFLMSCAVVSVSAANEGVSTAAATGTISVVLYGETYAFYYDNVATFSDLVNAEPYEHPDLGWCQFSVEYYQEADYVVLDIFEDTFGGNSFYLIGLDDMGVDGLYRFQTENDELAIGDAFVCSVSLGVEVNGTVYNFEYASCMQNWNDLVLYGSGYDHADLGLCNFITLDGDVYLELSESGERFLIMHAGEDGTAVDLSEELFSDGVGYSSFVTSAPCTDHTLIYTVISEATCTTKGVVKVSCKNCEYFDYEEQADYGHTWELLGRYEPTCTRAGYKSYKCASCGTTKKSPLLALGHSFGEWQLEKDPTCVESGAEVSACKLCGFEEVRTVAELGHARNLLGTCTRCGDNAVGNWWNGLWNNGQSGSSGSAGDNSASADDSSGDGSSFVNWLENLFKPKYEIGNDFIDSVDAVLSLLTLGLTCLVVVILLPVLKPILQFLGEAISSGFKAVSSGVRSLSKKVKSKTKKKK